MNFENPYKTTSTLVSQYSQHKLNLPIPDRFEILDMKQVIHYTPSINIDGDSSTISVKANNKFIKEYQLAHQGMLGRGIELETKIPLPLLYDGYNDICVAITQQPKPSVGGGGVGSGVSTVDSCMNIGELAASGGGGGGTPPSPYWTQIDLHNSYIEFDFKLKKFEERISSIFKFIFDNKNSTKDRVNFIFPTLPTETDFNNYGLLSNIAGNIMDFKDLDITISTKIDNNTNNIVIVTRDKLDEIFKEYDSSKLSGNINLIRNINREEKGILVITGDTQDEILSSIYRLTDSDMKTLRGNHLVVKTRTKPKKSRPYTAPKFIQFGEKIPFSDLDFQTRTFSGFGVNSIYFHFVTYPTREFSDENIVFAINRLNSNSSKLKTLINLFVNGEFSHQIIDSKPIDSFLGQKFEVAIRENVTAEALKKGKNYFRLDISVFPRDSDEICAPPSLQATIKDDSYFIIPKGDGHVELPELQYFGDLAFPFSIYPDLQNSAILITDFHAKTIASAMLMAFKLGQKIGYPGYYLTTTYDINKVLDKDIIVVGKHIEVYSPLYSNASLKFKNGELQKRVYLSKKFHESNEVIDTTEKMKLDNYFFTQSYQSPFNPKRVILDLTASNPHTLFAGVKDGLLAKNMGNFQGDVWLYNVKTEKSFSYRLGKEYVVEEMVDGYEDSEFEKEVSKIVDYF